MAERYNNIIEFDEISSTNDYAMSLVRNGEVADFTVVKANFQTKGRGQVGNHWVSNKGENLLFSVIVHPHQIPANEQFIISQCVSLALCNVVSLFCKDVCIKWPNDIYVGNKKIAGILIENLLKGRLIETSIIGIGLNVNQREFEGVPNPTSLQNEAGRQFDCETLLEQFLSVFQEYYIESQKHKRRLRRKYRKNLYLLRKKHLFKDNTGEFVGKIVSVENDGKLHIRDCKRNEREYYFKEVEYIL
ncbi:MAG: biotin--[acetyl-CoA-carboxylase] ligase [Bacteroidales bacterium]|nr:biotin--[acetyl-CoA-carboxylase] ligase [Bacteroidales bacterium]